MNNDTEFDQYLANKYFWSKISDWSTATPGVACMTIADKVEENILKPMWNLLTDEQKQQLLRNSFGYRVS